MNHIDPKKALLPLGLGTALSLMGDATLYTVLPIYTGEIGIALTQVGILLGINRAVRIVLNGPVGWMYDRLPRRILFVPALFAGALSTALYAVNGGFGVFLIGRLLWGLSWSFIWVGGTSIILDVANDKDRGYWMGLYQVWFFLGASVGALTGGMLTDLIGYPATMWASSLLTAIGGLIALIFLPETRRAHPASQGEHALNKPPKLNFKTGLASTISVYGVNRFVTNGILIATLGLLVQERMGNQYLAFGLASVTGVLSAGRNSVSMFSSVASGKISDRLGNRWIIILWSLALGAVGMAFLAWNSPVALLVGVLLAAIAGGGMQTISSTLTGEVVEPQQQGTAIGLMHTAGDFASAVGPPLAFAILSWIGFKGVYLLCGGLLLVLMIPVIIQSRHTNLVKLGSRAGS